MTDTSAATRSFSVGRLLLGVLIAVAGHALTFGAGFLAGRLVTPSPGGGFEDIAAVAMTFLGAQLLLALGCIVAGLVLARRGRGDLAAGLLIAWALGAAAVVAFLFVQP